MKNAAIAKIFRKIGFIIEMNGNDVNATFKARAYKRTSDVIASLPTNIEEIYRKERLEGLQKIPTIGKAIALKIEEYITTGTIKYYEELKATTPLNIDDFYDLEGIGPKTIKVLYDKLKIKDLSGLEKAASEGRLRNIQGYSQNKEETILKKIQIFKKGRGRHLIGEVYPIVKQIETRLSNVKGVKRAVAAGSFRRMKETVGDIDYLVVSDSPQKVMDYFVEMPEVDEVLGKGPSKTFVHLNNGMDADLFVVPEESFGSSLQYFTGSKEHGIAMRKIALAKGLHLNEWGIFDNDKKRVAGFTEEEVYQALDLDWIPPEMRENTGEIEIAKKRGSLPSLIKYDDLKGDLQVHSNNTDGTMSIEDMSLAAKGKFGLEYVAITDHTKSLKLTNGLDEKQILDQANKIAEINDKIKMNQHIQDQKNHQILLNNFRILSSAEVNIMKDGSLDIANNVLDKLDIVGAAIHSNFAQPIEVQTERLIKAAQNPSIDIIFHPTGRRINKREGYPVNILKLIDVAKDTDTVLEIDAHYDRLDLKDDYIRMAVENDIKLVIDSDAHHPVHFAFLKFGIGQARRGWAKQLDVLNTLPADTLLKSLK
ncbi:MAG TPA: DNA polymerase/3'-5' exonuclease PolX [Nitrososphaeraceae archaeon]|jgi:DNA polymerase (family 10)|nr:DNA polymerase/3'-5' exonuclease PolX [Nitrososphaeraceae archaeon]